MYKSYLVSVGEKVWDMGPNTLDAVIKTAKDSFKGKNAIVAIRKKSCVEMKKEEFYNIAQLHKRVKEYKLKGYEVYYVEEELQCD